MFTFFRERPCDPLSHLVDLVCNQVSNRGDIVREVEMNAGNGVSHVFGLVDQIFALIAQLGQKVPNPDFIVIVGTLKRGDFVVHERFQLRGTGKGAFHAISHGCDLAANGLSDRNNRFSRDSLGLREAHRHLGHGFGNDSHVLRAVEHMRENEEKYHRHRNQRRECNCGGKSEAGRHETYFRAI
jgi:hypothetical protein